MSKTDELHAAILAAADKIPVAPKLADLYAEANASFDDEPELDDLDGADLEDDDDAV